MDIDTDENDGEYTKNDGLAGLSILIENAIQWWKANREYLEAEEMEAL